MLSQKINLEPNEKILKIARKHWFVIVAELFGLALLGLVPLFGLVLAIFFPQVPTLLAEASLGYITIGVCLWFLLILMTGYMVWTHYYLDLWIITDRRIIIVDQVHFFHRNVGTLRLERVQDVESYVIGFIATILKFGTIKIQSAGSFEQNFKMTGLPDPKELHAIIQSAVDGRLSAMHPNQVLQD